MEISERIPQLTRLYLENLALDITSDGKDYVASLPDRTFRVQLLDASQDGIRVVVDERTVVALITPDAQTCWVTVKGRTFHLARSASPTRQATAHHLSSDLAAPMPGQVRSLNVAAGDLVAKGQLLAILEAMKMEIRLSAPSDARIASVEVRVGQSVDRGQVIIHLQPT